MNRRRIGLVVNPIAGMGGRVGLKGTDTEAILEKAKQLGAEPVSPGRAGNALDALVQSGVDFELLVGPGEMGELEAEAYGIEATVVGEVDGERTTAADTKRVVDEMVDRGIDLLLFAGGDGTARDVAETVGESVPALGIPTGVKVYSAVFASTPETAGKLAAAFVEGPVDGLDLREVMDIDEADYRANVLTAQLYGYLDVPYRHQLVQNPKASGSLADDAQRRSIARGVVEDMQDGRLYLLGPGTTTATIADELGLDSTLLGVDVIRDGELVGTDLNERDLLSLLADDTAATIVVGVIGGQGCLFGRGNQQFSPEVLRRVGVDNVLVVATEDKILSLADNALFVDTNDPELDDALAGYTSVRTGQNTEMVVRVDSF